MTIQYDDVIELVKTSSTSLQTSSLNLKSHRNYVTKRRILFIKFGLVRLGSGPKWQPEDGHRKGTRIRIGSRTMVQNKRKKRKTSHIHIGEATITLTKTGAGTGQLAIGRSDDGYGGVRAGR
ncbi:hypothetical protein EVAR_50917_1 [Eumeta japonica]|uniref:Uncharacterized protein n=1 Tax=Eumeta variegata TaxID=151549 RepID=A0A4C1Y2G5_EUMVA|nr:hypothetical protein EVAR_50917_1 [Eumeta japonica]